MDISMVTAICTIESTYKRDAIFVQIIMVTYAFICDASKWHKYSSAFTWPLLSWALSLMFLWAVKWKYLVGIN